MTWNPEPLRCVLCHVTDRDVAVGLLRYSKEGRRFFDTDARCRDHNACEKRAREAGLEWPLAPEARAEQPA